MELQQLKENSNVFVAIMGKPHSWQPCEQLDRNNQPLPTLRPALTYLANSGIRLLFAVDLSRPRTSIYGGRRYPLKGSPVVLHNFEGLALYNKVPHEGVRLYPGDAAWLYGAESPIVLAYGKNSIAVACCGRDRLLSKGALTRDDLVSTSVLNALVQCLDTDPRHIHVLARVGICPAHFKHPVTGIHASENRRILSQARTLDKFSVRDRDYLALETVIRAQCIAMGIPREHITWTRECPACEEQEELLSCQSRLPKNEQKELKRVNGVFVIYLP